MVEPASIQRTLSQDTLVLKSKKSLLQRQRERKGIQKGIDKTEGERSHSWRVY